MKRLARIWYLFGLVLLAACTPSFKAVEPVEMPTAELVLIDSLMWQQPDSALARLMPIFDTCMTTEYNRHYANLLLAELLYKNDYAQTNRIELQQTVSYFDSLVRKAPPFKGGGGILPPLKGGARRAGDSKTHLNRSDNLPFLTARAHYINGVGYYEHDSVVEACREYLKAIEVMEEHFEEKTLTGKKANFMALAYTHLTSLFSDQYLHEQAIYFGKLSLHYYNKYEALPWHIAWIMDEIGSQYEMLDNYDTANILYLKALRILPDTNNITYRDIATRLASLFYKKGESHEKSLKQLRSIIHQAECEKELFSRYINIGEIFYLEAQFDSAWYYLNKVFQGSQNINSKKQAAEWLVEIYKTQGKETEAIEYAKYLVPFANVEENQSSIKSQLTELYKSLAQRQQERLYHQEKMRNQRRLLTVVVGFLILMLFFIILYHINKKKKQHLETQIEAERHAHSMQQKALSGKLKKSNEALHDALQQLDDSSASSEIQSESKKDYNSFVEAPICRHILDTVHQQKFKSKIQYVNYKEYTLQKDQILALQIAADEYMDGFTVRLRKRFRGLTDEDATYCCLYLLDITDADIAALMQKAYATVCERRRKIKRIVGGEGNLAYTLRNLP